MMRDMIEGFIKKAIEDTILSYDPRTSEEYIVERRDLLLKQQTQSEEFMKATQKCRVCGRGNG